jgi:hypothetical protein
VPSGGPATFVATVLASKYSVLEVEQPAEKKLDEFYAKVFGISLAAVFALVLILDAASSPTPTYRDHRAEFAGIGADLEPFAQAWSVSAATDDAHATRPGARRSLSLLITDLSLAPAN